MYIIMCKDSNANYRLFTQVKFLSLQIKQRNAHSLFGAVQLIDRRSTHVLVERPGLVKLLNIVTRREVVID